MRNPRHARWTRWDSFFAFANRFFMDPWFITLLLGTSFVIGLILKDALDPGVYLDLRRET